MSFPTIIDRRNFTMEPMRWLINERITSGKKIEMRECIKYDVTQWIEQDMSYRFEHNGDMKMNITGESNQGKSNIMLHYAMLWSWITKQSFELRNIVYTLPAFNLLLRGWRLKKIDAMNLQRVNFKTEQGMAFCLDEAADKNQTGRLSKTIVDATADLEHRNRADRLGQFCAGAGDILHDSHYSLYAFQRNDAEKYIRAYVYKDNVVVPGRPENDVMWIGTAIIPYVAPEVYWAYYKPKMESIEANKHSGATNQISQLMKCLAKELMENKEYQSIPIAGKEGGILKRINWLESNPDFSIFPNMGFYKDLEAMSRNKLLNAKLTNQSLAAFNGDDGE